MIEASRLKLTGLTLWEWDQTDMAAWHRYASVLAAWRDGKRAGRESAHRWHEAGPGRR